MKHKSTFFLKKDEQNNCFLNKQKNDSPFSYHLNLKKEIEDAIESGQLKKYHFNFLRNILEKTATFLGYDNWSEVLSNIEDNDIKPYIARIINISSHSKHSSDEIANLSEDNKRVLEYLLERIIETYKFKQIDKQIEN